MFYKEKNIFLCHNEREICLQTLYVDMKKVRDNISKVSQKAPAKPKQNHLYCGNLGDFEE